MIKLILILMVGAGVVMFTPVGSKIRGQAVEAVNPVAKERKVLTSLQTDIEKIEEILEGKTSLSPAEVKELNVSLESVKENLIEAQEHAKDGDITATVSHIIGRLVREENTCPLPSGSPVE